MCVLWVTFVMCLQLWEGINSYFAQGTVEKLLCFLFFWLSCRRARCWGRGVRKTSCCRICWGGGDGCNGGGRGWQRRAERGQARTLCVCWAQFGCWKVNWGQRWLVRVGTGLGVICKQSKVFRLANHQCKTGNNIQPYDPDNGDLKMWKYNFQRLMHEGIFTAMHVHLDLLCGYTFAQWWSSDLKCGAAHEHKPQPLHSTFLLHFTAVTSF